MCDPASALLVASIGLSVFGGVQQAQAAKAEGAYKGRQIDESLHQRVRELLVDGKSIRKVAELIGCSTQTVQRVKRELAVSA